MNKNKNIIIVFDYLTILNKIKDNIFNHTGFHYVLS